MMQSHLEVADSIFPNTYDTQFLRAIYFFVSSRNIKLAKQEIEKCGKERIKNANWRYSSAFLKAYNGKMTEAVRDYSAAFKIGTTSATVIEVEEFIQWVLDDEPDKIQLHFCLGLINFSVKEDHQQALRDFNSFLDKTDPSLFPEQRKLADEYIGKIRSKN